MYTKRNKLDGIEQSNIKMVQIKEERLLQYTPNSLKNDIDSMDTTAR